WDSDWRGSRAVIVSMPSALTVFLADGKLPMSCGLTGPQGAGGVHAIEPLGCAVGDCDASGIMWSSRKRSPTSDIVQGIAVFDRVIETRTGGEREEQALSRPADAGEWRDLQLDRARFGDDAQIGISRAVIAAGQWAVAGKGRNEEVGT